MNLSDITLACGTRLIDADLSKLLAVRGYSVGRVTSIEIVIGNKEGKWPEQAGVKFDVAGSVPCDAEGVYANHLMAYAVAAHSAQCLADELTKKVKEQP